MVVVDEVPWWRNTLFLISMKGKCDIMSRFRNQCLRLAVFLYFQKSRVSACLNVTMLIFSCTVFGFSSFSYSFLVVVLFFHSCQPLWFSHDDKAASAAFSGTGRTESANRSLSFHRITTMFQFV